jgi:hypothetical protein
MAGTMTGPTKEARGRSYESRAGHRAHRPHLHQTIGRQLPKCVGSIGSSARVNGHENGYQRFPAECLSSGFQDTIELSGTIDLVAHCAATVLATVFILIPVG